MEFLCRRMHHASDNLSSGQLTIDQVDTSGKHHSTFSFVRFLISDFPPAEIPHLGDDNSPI